MISTDSNSTTSAVKRVVYCPLTVNIFYGFYLTGDTSASLGLCCQSANINAETSCLWAVSPRIKKVKVRASVFPRWCQSFQIWSVLWQRQHAGHSTCSEPPPIIWKSSLVMDPTQPTASPENNSKCVYVSFLAHFLHSVVHWQNPIRCSVITQRVKWRYIPNPICM